MTEYLVPLSLGAVLAYYIFGNRKYAPPGCRIVPEVDASYPLIGHSLSLGSDADNFISKSATKYGKIFKVKVCRKTLVMLGDPDMLEEYFKLKEEDLSLYAFFDALHFSYALCDDPAFFPTIMALIKKTAKSNVKSLNNIIERNSNKLADRIRSMGAPVDVRQIINHYILSTTMDCFVGLDVPDKFYEEFEDLSHLLNKAIAATYPLNTTMINLAWGKQFKKHRDELKKILIPKIEEFRESGKEEPAFLFEALDSGNEKVAEAIITLLFIGSENTTPCMVGALTSLVEHKRWYNECREESDFLQSPLVNACVMESARMNTQIIAGGRVPYNHSTLGGYYVGDADAVMLAGTLLMRDSDRFKDESGNPNPEVFDPERYLPPRNQPLTPYYILTWGNKSHHCPGRFFALHEIKLGLEKIIKQFDAEIAGTLPPRNYMSTNSFAERDNLKMSFNPIENN